uniref:SWIM-type domain-containing protein n=1 Tax=Panagrellus redivivus TaxID=6233 RepID=A0A7E4V2T5_PANRE
MGCKKRQKVSKPPGRPKKRVYPKKPDQTKAAIAARVAKAAAKKIPSSLNPDALPDAVIEERTTSALSSSSDEHENEKEIPVKDKPSPEDRRQTAAARATHMANCRAKLRDKIRRSERLRCRHELRRLFLVAVDNASPPTASVNVDVEAQSSESRVNSPLLSSTSDERSSFVNSAFSPRSPSMTDSTPLRRLFRRPIRPRFYNTTCNTPAAVARRRQRANARLPPEIRRRLRRQRPSRPARLTELQTLKFCLAYGLSSRRLRNMAKDLKKFKYLAPIAKCERLRSQLWHNAGYHEIPARVGYRRSLKMTLHELVKSVDLTGFTLPLRVTIGIDGGDILQHLDQEMGEIRQGFLFEGQRIDMSFFLVGDLKIYALVLGLQGCSATHCCPFCLVTLNTLNTYDRENPPEIRTMESLLRKYDEFAVAFQGAKKTAQPLIRRNFGSINVKPFLTNIKIDHIVPPILHLILGIVNECFACLKKVDKDRASDLLRDSGAMLQKGRKSDFTGAHGRILVDYVCKQPVAPWAYNPNLEVFRVVQPLFALAKFNADLTKAQEIIDQVIASFKLIRPLTPKLHILEAHVPSFLAQHNAWGIMSEQGVTSDDPEEPPRLHGTWAFQPDAMLIQKLLDRTITKKGQRLQPATVLGIQRVPTSDDIGSARIAPQI